MDTRLARYASPMAWLTGIVSIASLIFLALFFSIEAPQLAANPNSANIWGPLSDIAAPLAMLPLIVVMLVLHRDERVRAPLLSWVAIALGIVGAVAVILLQVMLVFKVLSCEQEGGPVVVAMGLVGMWLLAANYLGLVQHILPAKLAWLGILVGIAQAAYPVLFQILGGANFYNNIGSNIVLMILTGVIFLGSYIGFPIWAIWLGRVWSTQRKTMRVEAAYAG